MPAKPAKPPKTSAPCRFGKLEVLHSGGRPPQAHPMVDGDGGRKGEHDVMMLRHGAHCGLAQTYFADEDIFETLDDLDRKTSTSTARGR